MRELIIHQLQMIHRSISDSDRLASLVPIEMTQLNLLQFFAPMDSVNAAIRPKTFSGGQTDEEVPAVIL